MAPPQGDLEKDPLLPKTPRSGWKLSDSKQEATEALMCLLWAAHADSLSLLLPSKHLQVELTALPHTFMI